MPKQPAPDEFGHLRVRDTDTGHERTIPTAELDHGNYEVLSAPASDLSGDPLPPKHAAPKSPSRAVESTTNSGPKADTSKENDHG